MYVVMINASARSFAWPNPGGWRYYVSSGLRAGQSLHPVKGCCKQYSGVAVNNTLFLGVDFTVVHNNTLPPTPVDPNKTLLLAQKWAHKLRCLAGEGIRRSHEGKKIPAHMTQAMVSHLI
jgi:hypothetical protein